jgi:phage-related protein
MTKITLDLMLHICNNIGVKKRIIIDHRAASEILRFSADAQAKLAALLATLEKTGYLREPEAKKLNDDLYELRVRISGQWRALYAYVGKTMILILSAFRKTTPKTPTQAIKTALRRLKEHL